MFVNQRVDIILSLWDRFNEKQNFHSERIHLPTPRDITLNKERQLMDRINVTIFVA